MMREQNGDSHLSGGTNIDIKYPKSVDGSQCISQCYEKNTPITHPITLTEITNIKRPFCAVTPKRTGDDVTLIEGCDAPSTENMDYDYFSAKPSNVDLLYPIIYFDVREFLQKYYNIVDINDFNNFLKNNKSIPIFTKMRLIDCYIKVFGESVSVVENIISDTIIEIIKKFWIKKMYGKLCKYIGFEDNKLKIISPSKNNLSKSDNIVERTKFLIYNVFTHDSLFAITNDYFSTIGKRQSIGIDDFYTFLFSEIEKHINSFIL